MLDAFFRPLSNGSLPRSFANEPHVSSVGGILFVARLFQFGEGIAFLALAIRMLAIRSW